MTPILISKGSWLKIDWTAIFVESSTNDIKQNKQNSFLSALTEHTWVEGQNDLESENFWHYSANHHSLLPAQISKSTIYNMSSRNTFSFDTCKHCLWKKIFTLEQGWAMAKQDLLHCRPVFINSHENFWDLGTEIKIKWHISMLFFDNDVGGRPNLPEVSDVSVNLGDLRVKSDLSVNRGDLRVYSVSVTFENSETPDGLAPSAQQNSLEMTRKNRNCLKERKYSVD